MTLEEYYNKSTPDEDGEVLLSAVDDSYLRCIKTEKGEIKTFDDSGTVVSKETDDIMDIIGPWRRKAVRVALMKEFK